jgi:hypothetical protein
MLANLTLANIMGANATLAYVPFLHPLPADGVWYLLLIPMAFGIAVAYKGVRVKTFDHYWRQVLTMTAQTVLGIMALGAAFYVATQIILPHVAPMPG